MYGRHVNLTRLVAVYNPLNNKSRQTYGMWALVFSLLSRFLFVNGDNGARFSSLIIVAEQLKVGLTPRPLCVGEMITSMDVVKKDPKGQFSGSPPTIEGKNNFF